VDFRCGEGDMTAKTAPPGMDFPQRTYHHQPAPETLTSLGAVFAVLSQPWDATTVHPIEKAILKANLGLNPSVDRKVIRIVLRDLSQERRQEFVKIARKMAEDGRVAVRHVRRDALEALKKEGKSGGVTEDQVEMAEKEVQKLTDQYIGKIDAHLAHKEKEIMTV